MPNPEPCPALLCRAVAAYINTGQAVVADIFPPELRGGASGFFMIPLLVGPILGETLAV